MKLVIRTLLAFALIALVSSLHLSKQTQQDVPRLRETEQLRSYYGKHYRAHRSVEYVHRITEENLKMINDFNNRNQQTLRVSGSGSNVSGGNAFSMEPNKFLEFSEEEFLELFTGARLPKNQKHHDLEQLNHMSEQHQQNHQSQQSHDAGWVFEDPYKINDHELDLMYGSVNSDSNWGWDWKSFDDNYYNDFSNDYTHYWSDWETDHWNAKNQSTDTWWGGWFADEQKNNNNDNWWNNDPWYTNNNTNNKTTPSSSNRTTPSSNNRTTPSSNNNTTPSSNNNTTPSANNKTTPLKRTIAEYSRTAVQVNWNLKKATTHIKQQGECGSCWSFSTVGVVESYLLIMGQGTMDLSEQQLVDCQTSGSYGCDGGWPKNALDWVSKNGLVAEDKYPYRGVQQKCIHKVGPHKIPTSSQVTGRTAIENALRKGPVIGAVHADNGFQFYAKGIFDRCLSAKVNHAIILVGFTKDYWIIRNSWGADWGEDGHMRLKKDQNNKNACSVESYIFAINY